MSRKFLVYAALAALLTLSCAKEQVTDSPSAGKVRMRFSIGAPTKTVLVDDETIRWQAGDCISVFDLSSNNSFTTTDSGSVAEFTGEAAESSRYYFLYPYNEQATYSDGFVYTTLPAQQAASAGTFAPGSNLAVAKLNSSTTGSAVMKNCAGILKFTLSAQSANVTSVRVESLDDTPLCGKVKIGVSSDTPSMAAASSGAEDCVTLCSDAAFGSASYYLCVIPSQHTEGLKMTLTLSSGASIVKYSRKEFSFVRNEITDFGTITVSEEDADDTASNPVSAYASYGVDFGKLVAAGHPRLFLTEDDFDNLRTAYEGGFEGQSEMSALSALILAQADSYVSDASTVTYNSSSFLSGTARVALSRLFYLSYAYKITKAQKYLTKAVAELSAVCAFQDWNAAGQMLDPSELGLGVAVAYDWLYHDLTLAKRQAARTALKNYLLTPFSTYQVTTTSNWNQVCNGGAIAAAVVTYEKDKASCAAAIDKAVASNLVGADYAYSPNGNVIEGYGYWDYAMGYQQVIVTALETAFGSSCGIADITGFQKTGECLLYIEGATAPFSYSDTAHEKFEDMPMMLWLAARFSRPDLAVHERQKIAASSSYSDHRLLPLFQAGLVKYGLSSSGSSYPTEKLWYASDDVSPIIMMRDGWTYGSTDKYFGFKGCGASNNHSHMDAGSFVFDSRGVRWACDIYWGNYSAYQAYISSVFSLYQTSKRWDILELNNYFHNTLSFTWNDGSVSNKIHTTDQVVGANTGIKSIVDDAALGYGGTIDISRYYSDAAAKVERTVKMVGDDLYVIDEITALSTHNADFEWRMVTKTTPSLEGGCIKLTSGSKTAYVYTETSGNVASAPSYGYETGVSRPSGWTARDWDSCSNLSKYNVAKFSASVTKGKTATFTTVISTNNPNL